MTPKLLALPVALLLAGCAGSAGKVLNILDTGFAKAVETGEFAQERIVEATVEGLIGYCRVPQSRRLEIRQQLDQMIADNPQAAGSWLRAGGPGDEVTNVPS